MYKQYQYHSVVSTLDFAQTAYMHQLSYSSSTITRFPSSSNLFSSDFFLNKWTWTSKASGCPTDVLIYKTMGWQKTGRQRNAAMVEKSGSGTIFLNWMWRDRWMAEWEDMLALRGREKRKGAFRNAEIWQESGQWRVLGGGIEALEGQPLDDSHGKLETWSETLETSFYQRNP